MKDNQVLHMSIKEFKLYYQDWTREDFAEELYQTWRYQANERKREYERREYRLLGKK